MSRMYNDPAGGTPSQVGTQMNTFFYAKKALIELKKEQFFQPLADTKAMPKHHGKKIKQYHYLPLLDDRNINDQGIDAEGATLVAGKWSAVNAAGTIVSSGHNTQTLALAAAGAGGTAVQDGGNLYGSSKDVGAIAGKLPALSEAGGRVNRVGFKRIEIEGTFEKFGFFDEYTQESLDFDSDEELEMHVHREMLRGANEMTEDALQIDLLNAANTIMYAGVATQNSEVIGEGANISEVTYSDLMKLGIALDDVRTPKQTKVITGSRMTDTRTIAGARYLFCGSELIPTLKSMKDLHGNPAFVPVHQYADAANIVNGEIGSVDAFRIIVVPEMLKWAGQGATVTSNEGYATTQMGADEKYDVHPMLVVGEGSFTTIGFKTDGKSIKYTVYNKKPGLQTADRNDPYGEMGFMSIKWWYGVLILRAERIGLIKTVARL